MTDSTRLTHALLKTYLTYDKASGHFHWRGNKGSVKTGDRAGTVKGNGSRYIKIDRRYYREGRLAFFYVNGEWPSGMVRRKDRNPTNNAWCNLTLYAVPPAEYAETISKIQQASKKPKASNGLLRVIARQGKREVLKAPKDPEEQAWAELCHSAPEPYEASPASQRVQRLWHDVQLEREIDAHMAELEDAEMERNTPTAKAIRKALRENREAIKALEVAQRNLKALEELLH